MNKGTRVMVCVKDFDRYAFGCAAALDGVTGVVEDFSTDPFDGPKVLVRFDKPTPTWFTHQTPPTAWWLPPSDLETVS